jgi:hypothetical protein
MYNVIGRRVLTDSSELRYFRDHGMPFPAPLQPLAGTHLGGRGLSLQSPLLSDPRMAAFRIWVRDHGRWTLARYLATHPYRAFRPVVEHDEQLFLGQGDGALVRYRARGTQPLLPAALGTVVYPDSIAAILTWLVIVTAAAAWLAWRGLARAVWLVPVVTVLLQVPHAAIVWNGDTLEIPRHALLVGVLTRLGLLILTLFLVDAALEWRRQRSSGASAAQLAS